MHSCSGGEAGGVEKGEAVGSLGPRDRSWGNGASGLGLDIYYAERDLDG